jgi:hypothetical protein
MYCLALSLHTIRDDFFFLGRVIGHSSCDGDYRLSCVCVRPATRCEDVINDNRHGDRSRFGGVCVITTALV